MGKQTVVAYVTLTRNVMHSSYQNVIEFCDVFKNKLSKHSFLNVQVMHTSTTCNGKAMYSKMWTEKIMTAIVKLFTSIAV